MSHQEGHNELSVRIGFNKCKSQTESQTGDGVVEARAVVAVGAASVVGPTRILRIGRSMRVRGPERGHRVRVRQQHRRVIQRRPTVVIEEE